MTPPLYLTHSYAKTLTTRIKAIAPESSGLHRLELEQTLFYPQSGGQPADRGVIQGENGSLRVTFVATQDGRILHQGKLEGSLEKGDSVELKLDWKRRYTHMRAHTAGHILHEAIMEVLPEVKPVAGVHGIGKEFYLKYQGIVDQSLLETIEGLANQLVAQDEPVTSKLVTKEELEKSGIPSPSSWPKHKPLRIIAIGDRPPMPDGGTQTKSTAEVGPIAVTDITYQNGHSLVHYLIGRQPTSPLKETQATDIDLGAQIAKLKQTFSLEQKTSTPSQLQTKYLGKKGLLNQLTRLISRLPPEARGEAGKDINLLKHQLASDLKHLSLKVSDKVQVSDQPWVDITAPGNLPPLGHLHPVSQAIDRITHIFESIGFTRVRYPEVDWDYYVFEALNMPPSHPARDEWETFFIDSEPHPSKGSLVLSTHTSNGQVREMERLGHPPIRMLNIAKCYRRQQDVTHTSMFHQFEGLVVDRGINIQHLKGTLDYFAERFYGPGVTSRIRPFMFKFTEPSFEVDFSCVHCGGKGCRFCKAGWHEVGGAGMVHPNVLRSGGIDPDEFTGFAFGWGIERVYTLQPGLQLDDIRPLYQNNLEFLGQF